MLAGSLVALVSGIAAIWLFLRLLRTGAFYKFAWYVIPAGLLALALL
jgi:undecaprenyl pyrophosphate phosphatase UppP